MKQAQISHAYNQASGIWLAGEWTIANERKRSRMPTSLKGRPAKINILTKSVTLDEDSRSPDIRTQRLTIA